MNTSSTVTTFLFTDIEDSSRLWEQDPERMAPALARHDALARSAVDAQQRRRREDDRRRHACRVRRSARRDLRQRSSCSARWRRRRPHGGLQLRVRCGLHAGIVERRDNDFFGTAVNRAARIMSAAHGGQILLSQRWPRSCRRPAAGRRCAARPRRGAAARPRGPGTRLPGHAPALRQELSAAALARGARRTTCRSRSTSFIGRERELAEARRRFSRTPAC